MEAQDAEHSELKLGKFWADRDELVIPVWSKAMWLYVSFSPVEISQSPDQSSSFGNDFNTRLTFFYHHIWFMQKTYSIHDFLSSLIFSFTIFISSFFPTLTASSHGQILDIVIMNNFTILKISISKS